MKQIPVTTVCSAEKNSATTSVCSCADRIKKGGSYTCPMKGDKICKHIFMRRMQIALNGQRHRLDRAVWVMNLSPVLPADRKHVSELQAKASKVISQFKYIGIEA